MTAFNRVQRRRIGEILVDQGLVTRENVEEALRLQRSSGETLGSILVDMGCVTDLDIAKTIVVQYQLPYLRLENYRLSDKLCALFPAEFLYENKILPFDRVGSMILCAVAEVPSEEILAEIPRLTQSTVGLYVSSLTEVRQALEKLCPLTDEQRKAFDEKRNKNRQKAPKAAARAAAKAQIFNEESSEAILQALDSTWDSIFDNGEPERDESA